MKDQKVAFNICYEDGFGDELIATAKRSTLLANISNMAWYGKSNAMYQQLQQSQARAMELGRYMVRATNTGATAIISPKVRLLPKPNRIQKPSSKATSKATSVKTPYMKAGGSTWLISILAVIGVSLILIGRKKSE